MAINYVDIIGRISDKTIVVRKTSKNIDYCFFDFVVNAFNPKLGGVEESIFIPCMAWGKTVHLLKDVRENGNQKINIMGTLRTRPHKVDKLEINYLFVNVSKFAYCESKAKGKDFYHQDVPTEHDKAKIENDLPFPEEDEY